MSINPPPHPPQKKSPKTAWNLNLRTKPPGVRRTRRCVCGPNLSAAEGRKFKARTFRDPALNPTQESIPGFHTNPCTIETRRESFIFRGYNCYNPYFLGGCKTVKPCIFHGFGAQGYSIFTYILPAKINQICRYTYYTIHGSYISDWMWWWYWVSQADKLVKGCLN